MRRECANRTESDPDVLVSYALAAAGEINDDELNRAYSDLLDAPAGGKEAGLYYKRGVLILDLVDRKSKHSLWRGAIMAAIDMSCAGRTQTGTVRCGD